MKDYLGLLLPDVSEADIARRVANLDAPNLYPGESQELFDAVQDIKKEIDNAVIDAEGILDPTSEGYETRRRAFLDREAARPGPLRPLQGARTRIANAISTIAQGEFDSLLPAVIYTESVSDHNKEIANAILQEAEKPDLDRTVFSFTPTGEISTPVYLGRDGRVRAYGDNAKGYSEPGGALFDFIIRETPVGIQLGFEAAPLETVNTQQRQAIAEMIGQPVRLLEAPVPEPIQRFMDTYNVKSRDNIEAFRVKRLALMWANFLSGELQTASDLRRFSADTNIFENDLTPADIQALLERFSQDLPAVIQDIFTRPAELEATVSCPILSPFTNTPLRLPKSCISHPRSVYLSCACCLEIDGSRIDTSFPEDLPILIPFSVSKSNL